MVFPKRVGESLKRRYCQGGVVGITALVGVVVCCSQTGVTTNVVDTLEKKVESVEVVSTNAAVPVLKSRPHVAKLKRLSVFDAPKNAKGVCLATPDIACVADYHYGLWLVDIRDVVHPVFMGKLSLKGVVNHVSVSGGYAYLASSEGIYVVDIRNPQEPQLVSTFPCPGMVTQIIVDGDRLIAVCNIGGVLVLDKTDPIHLQTLGVYAPKHCEVSGGFIQGNLLYVTDRTDGLCVLDIGDPKAIQLLGRSASSEKEESVLDANGILVHGTSAYVLDDGFGLRVYEVGTPQSPRLLNSVEFVSNCHCACLGGTNLYMGVISEGVFTVNMQPEGKIRLADRLLVEGYPQGMIATDELLFVAAGSDGLLLLSRD